jgi:alpha-glucosidase
MKQAMLRSILLPALLAGGLAGLSPATAADRLVVQSPDHHLSAELSATGGTLRYRILLDGRQLLAPSRLGIRSDGAELGEGVTLGAATSRAVHETYRFFGAHNLAVNDAREASVKATSHGETYWVDLHVANDGVGVRLRLAPRKGRKVEADRSAWMIEGNPTIWADKLDPSYESHYRTLSLSDLGSDLYGMPVTARVGSVYLSITEAALKDYGDLALKRAADGALEGQLYADPQGWTTDDAVIQPWRVTVVARTLTDLVNTTLVQNLNPPAAPELAKADWIKPGRSTWQWMAIGDPKENDQEQWVDWTRQLGYEYYLVDEGWEHWSDPWGSLAKVVAYAKPRNVKIWLWVHSNQVRTPDARRAYFQKAVEAGVVGVKIDFPQQANRWWATWYHDTARDAAAMKLLVDFHGANKPTGMDRTWPNVLTREGVRGHEWHMTRYNRTLEPAHDTILPFTRYIAGPGDYTPTVFDPIELRGISWAHEVAQAITFTSPFLCFGGHPKDFVANPARDVLMALPATWDETRVLKGSEPGVVVAEARRKGDQWFIAVMNGGAASTLDLPLDFLGAGKWTSSQLFDAKGNPYAWDLQERAVTRADHIRLDLAPRGGFVGWIRKG